MKNKTMLNVTNAKVMFPPFEGWDPNFIVSLADQHEPRFTCDEMVLSETVVDGEVTLNGQTYLVTYDEGAVNHTDGCELPAEIVIK